MAKDIGMTIRKGIVPTLFGCFLGIPSLYYVLSFVKCFFVTFIYLTVTYVVLAIHVFTTEFTTEIDVFGQIVCNNKEVDTTISVWGKQFVVPAGSSFLLSDISKISILQHASGMRFRYSNIHFKSLYPRIQE